jgi:hypothetical protein
MMRIAVMVTCAVLLASGAASAQDMDEYVNREDGFSVLLPGTPTKTETTWKSEYGVDLPAHVYTLNTGTQRYTITFVDYRRIKEMAEERANKACPDGNVSERACGFTNAGRGYYRNEIGGALIWATWQLMQGTDKTVTHLGWQWQDLIPGHEIQWTNNATKERTFAYVTQHANKMFIIEATVPGNYPPPAFFQQSLQILDDDGRIVRYTRIYSNPHAEWPEDFPAKPMRTGGGGAGAGAAAPAAPAAPAGR